MSIFRQLGDLWGIAGALLALGFVGISESDYRAARASFDEQFIFKPALLLTPPDDAAQRRVTAIERARCQMLLRSEEGSGRL